MLGDYVITIPGWNGSEPHKRLCFLVPFGLVEPEPNLNNCFFRHKTSSWVVTYRYAYVRKCTHRLYFFSYFLSTRGPITHTKYPAKYPTKYPDDYPLDTL